jgi:hypothetical protein
MGTSPGMGFLPQFLDLAGKEIEKDSRFDPKPNRHSDTQQQRPPISQVSNKQIGCQDEIHGNPKEWQSFLSRTRVNFTHCA